MRIGIDARNVTPKTSGLVDYVLNLIDQLSKQTDDSLYIFYNAKFLSVFDLYQDKPHIQLIPCYFASSYLNLVTFLYEQFRFSAVIKQYPLDIMHFPYGQGLPFNCPFPSIFTIHDVIPLIGLDKLTPLQTIIYQITLHIALKKATHLVTISEFTKKELCRFTQVNPEKISVIYNGFDNLVPLATNQNQEIEKQFSIQKPYLLYIGSATPRKNLERLVQGFISARKSGMPYQLVLCSKFDRPITIKTKNTILSLLDTTLQKEVVFIGYVDDARKAQLISQCEAFIYPSLYEGFGLPILEALAFQKPVLASRIEPFLELFGNSIHYFDPLDYNAIAQSICQIEMMQQATLPLSIINQTLQMYSWQKMAVQYELLFKKIITHS